LSHDFCECLDFCAGWEGHAGELGKRSSDWGFADQGFVRDIRGRRRAPCWLAMLGTFVGRNVLSTRAKFAAT
jgi:hypothetical protein